MASHRSFKTDLIPQSRVEVLFPVFATFGVLVRLGLRYKYRIALRWDDALIVFSLFFAWGLWGVWQWTTVNLVGNPELALRPTTPALLQKLCFAMELLYGEGINIVKFAILLFYLRAFGTNPNARNIRLIIYNMIGIVGIYTVARGVETAFVCPPTCTGSSKTYNVAAWQFAMTSLNWITEITILLIPVPILWGMKLPKQTKIGIYACFFLGIVTCVASALRMASTVELYLAQVAAAKTASANNPADLQQWFLNYYIPQMSRMTRFSLAELNVGIITATLPAIRSPAIAFARSTVAKIRRTQEDAMNNPTAQPSFTDITDHSALSRYASEKDLPESL